MKEYIINFYRQNEVKFITSIKANNEIEAKIIAMDLFERLKVYDEFGVSI